MTAASNRLFSGEFNGNTIAALDAIESELCYEANQMERSSYGEPPDQTDLDLAKSFRDQAESVNNFKVWLQKEISSFEKTISARVLSEHLAGEWSQAISESLQDGAWERCAI